MPALPGTLPVGIFSSLSTVTDLLGIRILPAATSSSSSSLASSDKKGTNFATGRFRSRIMISSPLLANVRYLLRRFFSSAILTLRIAIFSSHGYYSHDRLDLETAFAGLEPCFATLLRI